MVWVCLEPVMHFGWWYASGHEPESVPERCERRRVGVRGALPDPDEGGRAPAGLPPARGVRRPALDRARGGGVADDAQRPAAVARRLPADPALAEGGRLRGDRPRPAPPAARDRGAGPGA